MAKLERTFPGNFDETLYRLHHGILNGSMSASYEDEATWSSGNVRCVVRVYERYSYMGGNRVSMNLTLLDDGSGMLHLIAITSGGSQAVFWKLNTMGEEAFLDKLRELLP